LLFYSSFYLSLLLFQKPTKTKNKQKIKMGYAKDKAVVGAHEYDKAKEKAGFIAGKHIHKKSKWWFQSSPAKQNNWDVGSDNNGDNKTTTTTTKNDDTKE
jgi:hypothetical protein